MNGINDSFSHGLGGDTLAEYYFNKVKQKTKEDYFPPLNSEDLIGDGDSVGDDEEQEPAHDYSLDYLTFVALEDGTFSFSGGGSSSGSGNDISYSLDNGETWVSLPKNTATPTISAGSEILWKKSSPAGLQSYAGIGHFSSTNSYEVKGNIMSLFYEDDFIGQTRIPDPNDWIYRDYPEGAGIPWYLDLFRGNTYLISAENLSLPIILGNAIFARMFEDCTSLTTAPELPATTLASSCYSSMFKNCTSLTTAPELPATTLAPNCYASMFGGCTSLTSTPELPATTLAYSCYQYMFNGCTSLTTAPELPATTLTYYCYQFMFQGCTSLVEAPTLPATTLENYCYSGMFNGCTSLNYIKAMFTTTISNNNYYTENWVNNVAATGTFVKNSAATWNVSGVNGIPTNWTVETADE